MCGGRARVRLAASALDAEVGEGLKVEVGGGGEGQPVDDGEGDAVSAGGAWGDLDGEDEVIEPLSGAELGLAVVGGDVDGDGVDVGAAEGVSVAVAGEDEDEAGGAGLLGELGSGDADVAAFGVERSGEAIELVECAWDVEEAEAGVWIPEPGGGERRSGGGGAERGAELAAGEGGIAFEQEGGGAGDEGCGGAGAAGDGVAL